MHELSLLESVRGMLEQQAIEQHFTKVTQVTLEIGALSSVEPEAIRFGFDIIMQGSLAEQAELIIMATPGLGLCQNCQQEVAIATLHDPCPLCAHFAVKPTQGTEMKIKELNVL